MKPKLNKMTILSIVAAFAGVVASLLSSVATQQQMNAKIAEEVQKTLKK